MPWLDDADVHDHELRGVIGVSLLGTLEEVGYDIRPGVERIWAGERDVDSITAGVEPKVQAALTSVLWHTHKLELQYGTPPQSSSSSAATSSTTAERDGEEDSRQQKA